MSLGDFLWFAAQQTGEIVVRIDQDDEEENFFSSQTIAAR